MILARTDRNGDRTALWLRCAVVCCILFFAVMATAQACHIHPEEFRSGMHQDQQTSALDHCPLCMAMHASALPASLHLAAGPALEVQAALVAAVQTRVYSSIWAYHLSNRPPPTT